ncbi:hypothetical protein GJV85_04425 [Sulfurimonas aquatica]|uniref:Lipoprotein n=1 Tax=Sulfurimonas aquatica TaxID=2672570 RepID=A0A975AZD7_9BACT|nr:hypothetical protein [Sulfurimonas aquatica]QSZ41381.1 hypothetical protein GJV85_04425 [Sulfurimonas aquatica]
MFYSVKKTYLLFLLLLSSIFIMSGCAKSQILLNTYVGPKKPKEVTQMLDNSDSSSGYLEIELVHTILSADGIISDKSFESKLLSSLKKFITQTNFISVSEVEDNSNMSLDMRVLVFNYKESTNSIDGLIGVEFNIRKDGTVFYTQNYKHNIKRYSKAGKQGLPSKGELFSEAADYLAKKLIKDISPMQTRKLVELMPLPSSLEYTIAYAKRQNFEGAIKGMKTYQGEKTAEYYFNFGVYCEALASQTDDLALLTKANEYYEKAMELSQGDNEIIIKGKAKFDKYYKIIQKVADQKAKNAEKDNNSMFQIL